MHDYVFRSIIEKQDSLQQRKSNHCLLSLYDHIIAIVNDSTQIQLSAQLNRSTQTEWKTCSVYDHTRDDHASVSPSDDRRVLSPRYEDAEVRGFCISTEQQLVWMLEWVKCSSNVLSSQVKAPLYLKGSLYLSTSWSSVLLTFFHFLRHDIIFNQTVPSRPLFYSSYPV